MHRMLPAVVVDGYGDPTHLHLTEYGAVLVGIDSVNIEDTTTRHGPAHTALLRAGIPVVEHLTNLSQPPATGARFTAVPR